MLLQLLGAAALVIANGFFVTAEFAITSVRPTLVDEMEEKGLFGAGSVRHAVDRIDAYLSATQLGITMASLGLGVVGEPAFAALLHPLLGEISIFGKVGLATGIAFIIITLLHVVVGELAPKSLAISRTAPIVRWIAPPMWLFYMVTKPIVDLFNGLGNLLLKPFGIPPAREGGYNPHSENELRKLIRQSDRQGMIDTDEREFTENVLTFGDHRAREIMTPRPRIEYVTADQDPKEIARSLLDIGRTRYPLCEPQGGLDAPIGMLHIKDFLAAVFNDAAVDLRALARSLPKVSESTQIDALLTTLRRDKQHLALVIDEHDTTTGLISLEDILEEIVGDIQDEFDEESERLIVAEGGAYRVSGATPVSVLHDELGIELKDIHEATISGHLLEILGRIPEKGETMTLENFTVEIQAVGEARIEEIRLTPIQDADDGEYSQNASESPNPRPKAE